MNLGALSLENAPGFWTPLRFFLTVPVFGMLAAVVIMLDDGQLLQSRWLPASLAVTHAFTIGYIAMAMLGALFQMLPVVVGASLPQAGRAASIVHLSITAGSLCLVFAFLWQVPGLFTSALVLIVPPLIFFATGVVLAISRAANAGSTARAAQLAAFGLLVTVLTGAYLAAGHAFESVPANRMLTDYHAAWGIIGWISVLVIGVSGQVIPMFVTTPPYPQGFNKRLAYLLILLLCAGSLLPVPLALPISVILASALMLSYAFVTLYLLSKRRRKRFDMTQWFWRVGMLSLVLGVGVNLYGYVGGLSGNADIVILSGVLLLAGFAVSVINGMLYKIVPFLVWLNLRMPAVMGKLAPGTKYYTPNIHEVIDVRAMKLQFLFHLAGLLLLVVAVFLVGFPVHIGAGAMLVSNLLLLINLVQGVRLYRKYSSQVIAIQ